MSENIREKFLDYLEGRLDPEDQTLVTDALEKDQELNAEFQEFQAVYRLTDAAAHEKVEVPAELAESIQEAMKVFVKQRSSIMTKIKGFFKGIGNAFLGAGIAGAGLVVLGIMLSEVGSPNRNSHLVNTVFTYIEGGLGALLMVFLGIGAIVLSAGRKFRFAGGFVTAGLALFMLRSTVSTSFNDTALMGEPRKSYYDAGSSSLATTYNDHRISDSSSNFLPSWLSRRKERFNQIAAPIEGEIGKSQPGGVIPPPSDGHYAAYNQTHQVEPVNSEEYADWGENPRKLTVDEGISTFSIDVDTGSYTNARRFLQQGTLPPQDSIRIEEFINYFKYDYPQQYEQAFSLNYEIASMPLDPQRYLLKLGLKARDISDDRKPWNLVFLIDVSGSMSSENKIGLVRRSFPILVDNMKEGDRVAIVTYAGNAGLRLDSTGVNGREHILETIASLQAVGSTHGSQGIQLAYQTAQRNLIPGGVNRVILATDGDFNVGITSQDGLISFIEEKRKSGITLTTLGFGDGNYKEATMEQLANKGNGNYFYIDSFKEARKVFQTDLTGNMEVVAKDVKLQIEFNPEHVVEYRLIGYDNRRLRKQDFDNDAIDAGEIGSGHAVTALYELVLTGTDAAKSIKSEYRYQKEKAGVRPELKEGLSKELAFLKIRYKAPDGNRSTKIEFPIKRVEQAGEASVDFKFAAAVSAFGHLLRGSQYAGSYTFKDIEELAAKNLGKDPNGYRREFLELVRNAAATRH